jgi:hypothetical protein
MTTLTTCDGKEINPHWSDDPRFTSQAHYDAVMYGKETLNADNDLVYLGVEDGVATYVSRKNISGVDVVMQQDHLRNEALGKAQQALHEYYKAQRAEGEK